jgi:redox-sensing transcriptional repressor
MLIGFTGNFRHGYSVADLIHQINEVLIKPQSLAATNIGMGKSGQAILEQIHSSPFCPVYIPVTFDLEPANTSRSYSNVPCHNLIEAPVIIQQNNIRIAILTLHDFELQEIVDSLIPIGIENFINCTSEIITVPKHITLREFNLISLFDELGHSLRYH